MPPAPDLQGSGSSVSSDENLDADATVPRAALLAEREKRQAAELTVARLEGQVGGLQQAAPAPAPEPEPATTPIHTRAQLKAWVEDGTITEDAAQSVWDEQTARANREAAENAARAVLADTTAAGNARATAQQYIDAVPQIAVAGSPENMRVQTEYQKLVASGSPPNDHTTTIALRFVYGAPERLTKTPAGERQVHNETGGRDESGGDESDDDKDGAPKDLTQRERDHYSRLITAGAYSGWGQVKEEMKFATPTLREKMRRVA